MKKSLFIAVFIALLVLPGGQISHAQVTSAEVESIVQKITDLQIQLLLARIAELQAQIAELIAKQTQTQSSVVDLGARVETVATQTAKPVAPAPTPVSVTLGTASCSRPVPSENIPESLKGLSGYPVYGSGGISVPVEISGSWSELKLVYYRYPITAQQNGISFIIPTESKQKETVTIAKLNEGWNPGYFSIQNYPGSYEVDVFVNGQSLGAKTVTVNACQ